MRGESNFSIFNLRLSIDRKLNESQFMDWELRMIIELTRVEICRVTFAIRSH